MDNKDFSKVLEARTTAFALEILRFTSGLPERWEYGVLRNQLAKSGTSIGANYREANRARSKADFMNKISICECEANETKYWLEILKEFLDTNQEKAKILHRESVELLAIFTSIGASLRKPKKNDTHQL